MAEAIRTTGDVAGPVQQRVVLSPRSAYPGARPAAEVVTPAPQAEAAPVLVSPKKAPTAEQKNRKRMAIALFCVLLALLVLALVAFNWDSISSRVNSARWTPAATPTSSSPPIYQASNAQGAQDNVRAETTENRRADRAKCLETLRLRRVVPEVAQDTCNKMVQGIYH